MKRVLIVDDSSFMRKSLTHILSSDGSLEIIGTAADGVDGVRLVRELGPDVVVLDLEMARMNGLTALAHIMAMRPTPVLVLTGAGEKDATLAARCLERGAVGFLPKPSGVISYDIAKLGPLIIAGVKRAAARGVGRAGPAFRQTPPRAGGVGREKIVVIGASTGGPQALDQVLPALPPDLGAAVLVVQHMGPEFVGTFAGRLRSKTPCAVVVAGRDEPLRPGRIVVAPGGCHALVERTGLDGRVRLSREGAPEALFPCVDYAMRSAAEAYGSGAVGVVLSGMGHDGAHGMRAIRDAGGRTIAQDPSTCLAGGMPRAAMDLGGVERVVSLPLVARAVAEVLGYLHPVVLSV